MSSKKKPIGTSSTRARSNSRLAPIRFTPRSYFCTCWKVRPSASPSFSWLMPSRVRRRRTRVPTCTSIGLGRGSARAVRSRASSLGMSRPFLCQATIPGQDGDREPRQGRRAAAWPDPHLRYRFYGPGNEASILLRFLNKDQHSRHPGVRAYPSYNQLSPHPDRQRRQAGQGRAGPGLPARRGRRASAPRPRQGQGRACPSRPAASPPVAGPGASKTAEIPVCAARTSGSPSSTARSRAAARCCQGPAEMPNQPSLVMFTSQSGRGRGTTAPEKMTS